MKPLNEQPLFPKDWLRRRLTRFVRKGQNASFRASITLGDIAHWFQVDYKLIMHMEDGRLAINDKWQVKLSQFFTLLDAGEIELHVDKKNRVKSWARATPKGPACKVPMPRIDFAAGKVRFD